MTLKKRVGWGSICVWSFRHLKADVCQNEHEQRNSYQTLNSYVGRWRERAKTTVKVRFSSFSKNAWAVLNRVPIQCHHLWSLAVLRKWTFNTYANQQPLKTASFSAFQFPVILSVAGLHNWWKLTCKEPPGFRYDGISYWDPIQHHPRIFEIISIWQWFLLSDAPHRHSFKVFESLKCSPIHARFGIYQFKGGKCLIRKLTSHLLVFWTTQISPGQVFQGALSY